MPARADFPPIAEAVENVGSVGPEASMMQMTSAAA
jgi:hypothetical protein